jgi:hypothetical protein
MAGSPTTAAAALVSALNNMDTYIYIPAARREGNKPPQNHPLFSLL